MATAAPDRSGTESSPPGRRRRFGCFDGLRAIAALSVMYGHSSFASGLNVRSSYGDYFARLDAGVAIFFLVSGFLLYRPFVARAFEQQPAPATRPYFRRRFLRIYPAYWVCLTAVLLFFPHPKVENVFDLFLHYTLLQAYTLDTLLGPVQQAWSLATEVSFYVFLPCYAWLLSRIVRNAKHRFAAELIGVATLYAISVVSRLIVLESNADPGFRGMFGTWLIARLDQFALGMFLAIISVWGVRHRFRVVAWFDRAWVPGVSWVLAGASYWAVSTRLGLLRGPLNNQSVVQMLGLQGLYGLVAFFLLLPAVFGPEENGLVRRLLRSGVVAWLGLISYGIYLWHEAWLDAFLDHNDYAFFQVPFWQITVFMTVFTIVTAAASWYVLERPILQLKDRPLFARRRHVNATPDSAGRGRKGLDHPQ